MISTAGMVVCLSIMAGGTSGYVNDGSLPASKASIAFIFGKMVCNDLLVGSMHNTLTLASLRSGVCLCLHLNAT